MKIAIVGGGFMGLCLAEKLSRQGHELTLIEKEEQLGGLATYHDYGSFFWDRFYHVILPTDNHLLQFLSHIGLDNQLRWHQTYTGVYVDGQFYSVSNTKEFLLFPPLNLFQKFRLALTILIGSRINNWQNLEKITSEQWLIKYSGKTTYNKFWKPLLLAKLGPSYKNVSAVFIWTYIKRLFEARNASSAKQEQLGYVQGGYKTVIDRIEKRIIDKKGVIRKATIVEKIDPSPSGGIHVHLSNTPEHFDKVICTTPVNILQRIVSPDVLQIKRRTEEQVQYLGVVCMVLVLKKNITPFYVLNLADENLPFTGVIGMSTLVDVKETGGKYLVYLPKYIISTDNFLDEADDEIQEIFLKSLFALYPDLKMNDIEAVFINRARKVQPLQVINYSKTIPKVKTLHNDLYVLNTSQFVNNTLNNNSVVEHVNDFFSKHHTEFVNQLDE